MASNDLYVICDSSEISGDISIIGFSTENHSWVVNYDSQNSRLYLQIVNGSEHLSSEKADLYPIGEDGIKLSEGTLLHFYTVGEENCIYLEITQLNKATGAPLKFYFLDTELGIGVRETVRDGSLILFDFGHSMNKMVSEIDSKEYVSLTERYEKWEDEKYEKNIVDEKSSSKKMEESTPEEKPDTHEEVVSTVSSTGSLRSGDRKVDNDPITIMTVLIVLVIVTVMIMLGFKIKITLQTRLNGRCYKNHRSKKTNVDIKDMVFEPLDDNNKEEVKSLQFFSNNIPKNSILFQQVKINDKNYIRLFANEHLAVYSDFSDLSSGNILIRYDYVQGCPEFITVVSKNNSRPYILNLAYNDKKYFISGFFDEGHEYYFDNIMQFLEDNSILHEKIENRFELAIFLITGICDFPENNNDNFCRNLYERITEYKGGGVPQGFIYDTYNRNNPKNEKIDEILKQFFLVWLKANGKEPTPVDRNFKEIMDNLSQGIIPELVKPVHNEPEKLPIAQDYFSSFQTIQPKQQPVQLQSEPQSKLVSKSLHTSKKDSSFDTKSFSKLHNELKSNSGIAVFLNHQATSFGDENLNLHRGSDKQKSKTTFVAIGSALYPNPLSIRNGIPNENEKKSLSKAFVFKGQSRNINSVAPATVDSNYVVIKKGTIYTS